MNKKDRERIEYIKENGDGYVTIQEKLDGKKEGQTQFNIPGKKRKPRQMPLSEEQNEENLKEWERWITQKKPYGKEE